VAVTTPTPGGGTSSALTLAVLVVAAVNPPAPMVMVGEAQQFTATVTGSTNQATWSVNGVVGGSATVGTIGNTGLYAAPAVPPVPNVVTVQAVSLTGPTWSATASVTIVNPAPTISSISPATVFALSGATLLTVTGSGFTAQSTLSVNGSALPATVVSSTEFTATMSALKLAQPAAFNLVVSNPAPGGGASAPATFTVLGQGSVTPTGNPQVALYSFSSPRDASVSIEFGQDTTYGLKTWAQNTPPGGGAVEILVAGMLANTTYHMRADVSFPDGTQFVDTDHTFATGGLPAARLPKITITNPNGLTPSPGAILLDQLTAPANQVMAVAVDNAGNVIWYYDYNSSLGYPEPLKLLPNGHVLLNLGNVGISEGTVQEIDLAGNIIMQFTLADLNNWLSAAGYNLVVFTMNHDFLALPNGHLILLVNHYKECTSIPGCVGTADVRGDALIDLDQNHKPVWVWDSFDHVCPATPTSPCLYINRLLPGGSTPDWLHSNGLAYSPDDGNILVSALVQSWVLKIDYQDGQGSGDILWRLGYQGDFTLTNGQNPDWFYGQHYPTILSPNSTGVFDLGIFDDGSGRVVDAQGDRCGSAGQPACYTRIPIFQVDEVGMTATLLWQDILAPTYNPVGGAMQLLNDNRVAFGVGTPNDDPGGARYMEVTHDPTPLIVLRMEVSGQEAYRMEHLPSLYPGVQW
jgi:hypothetical protein